MTDQKPSRREAILHALVELLETDPGARITTAGLARSVGVTEAALYRHFPSKRKMFEALIEFAEEAVFSRCQVILQEQEDVRVRLQQLVHLVLVFAERNPGLCCVLTGDALMGENDALRRRASQFFERLETQVRQTLKEGEIRQGLRPRTSAARGADYVLVFVEGRIQRFVRSSFSRLPSTDFDESWGLVAEGVWG
ncbi:nucleoid occlusion factor SlmA [Marinobacter sp. SS8-8]|jgi:TetR/AcrR family transcriptional regulator|uniref:nucleoid occlusion factor SlmA n=1 Tax=Marinobacter sp. SS8-8 TaxID=3050452 RepID=UPI000C64DDF2|nr:nucleoid occlusion factor SlmA [Marinobacter sp. SS8-8]MAZ05000.1 nucleoid occlusion factor SlmA [Halomonas sp.]|tara:strand:+ start:17060 stop:17647 length:588 start_codon:yes stop_codon:yes gene_type:complete